MKTSTIVQLVFIVVAAVAVFCFIRSAQNDQRHSSCSALCALNPVYAGRDRTAPDFELPDMTGKPVKLSSFRGKTVFLNFWSKTCGPCLEEMPALAELANVARNEKDLVVVTVTTDEGPDAVRDTLKVALGGDGIPFPVLFDPESKVVLDRYGTRLVPETWIIDPKGVIRARFDGTRDWAASLPIEIGKMVQKPGGCPVEFAADKDHDGRGKPLGPFAFICGDDS